MKTKFKKDILTIYVILFIPIVAYSYLLFPERSNVMIFNYEVNSGDFSDIQTYVWLLVQKLMFVMTFITWYLTCKSWWKKILLVPLTVFVFQLITAIDDNLKFIDEYEILIPLLISIPVIWCFVKLTNLINTFMKLKQVKTNIELEVDSVLKDLNFEKQKKYSDLIVQFEKLKNLKSKLDNKTYLRELLRIQNELIA